MNKKNILFSFLLFSLLFLFSCAPQHTNKKPIKYSAVGIASWYGPGFAGRKTANGERYNPGKLTAAHKKLPFGTTVKVTNLANNKTVVVRINDRGPYIGGRIIDLSKAAANKLDMVKKGTAKVKIEAINSRK